MPGRIADRLLEQRGRLFGRRSELELIHSAALAKELPFCVVSLYGPGGVGKSTVLDGIARLCASSDLAVVRLEGARIDPSPEGFRQALTASGFSFDRSDRQILLVDEYEALHSLESWLRATLLPSFSDQTLTVLAGRKPIGPAWRSAPEWSGMVRCLPLRNLDPDDSVALLESRGVPRELLGKVLASTHGFPLALSLACEVIQQRGSSAFSGTQPAPDVVQALVERFLDDTPSPQHRAVLEAASLIRVTTEPALARLLELTDSEAREIFGWLAGLSLMETAQPGLAPHPVVREALLSDLRWRNPERWTALHRKARAYYRECLLDAGEREQQRLLWDYVFLHQDNPVVRGAFSWQDASAYADQAKPSDLEQLASWVERYEGSAARDLLGYWWDHPAFATTVFRDGESGEAVGFLSMIHLELVDAAGREKDPLVNRTAEYLERNAPLRPGERATVFRFWMARDTYHDVSPIQSQILVNTVRYYVTARRLAYTFFPVRNPEFWEPVFLYAEAKRCREAEVASDTGTIGLFCHDWRAQPPSEWLRVLGEKEVAGGSSALRPSPAQPYLVLSQSEFQRAVREAIKALHQPERLATSPLLKSRVVLDRITADEGSTGQKVSALQSLLRESSMGLQGHAKRERGYRALAHTYLRPAATQERAAEILDLPFSTYRRHLAEGLDHVAQSLWLQEIGSDLK